MVLGDVVSGKPCRRPGFQLFINNVKIDLSLEVKATELLKLSSINFYLVALKTV